MLNLLRFFRSVRRNGLWGYGQDPKPYIFPPYLCLLTLTLPYSLLVIFSWNMIIWKCILLVLIDIPMSVGVIDIKTNPSQLNAVEFLWDPTKCTSAFIQV